MIVRPMHILPFLFGIFCSLGCYRLTIPPSWTASGAKDCDLERIWSHTIDGLAVLGESDLATCEAACKQSKGEACVGAGLMLYRGTTTRGNKSEARRLFHQQCEANLLPGCVSSWLSQMDEDVVKGRRFADTRGLAPLERLCEMGARHACEALGHHFQQRLFTLHFDFDSRMAARYLTAACKMGSSYGCTGLAWLHLSGEGAPKDEKKAVEMLEQQCRGGYQPACATLGLMYAEGIGGRTDAAKSEELLRTACNGGVPKACYKLGTTYWYDDDDDDDDDARRKVAFEYFQKACAGAYGHGCQRVGSAYLEGLVVARNPSRGLQYHQAACELEIGDACHSLGVMFAQGENVAEDSAQAFRYFELGCKYGDPPSCNMLGLHYLDGHLVDKNLDEAGHYFFLACIGHEAQACYHLGRMAATGQGGIVKGEQRALKYLRKACDGNWIEACVELRFYGRYVTFRPDTETEKLAIFQKACDEGNMQGCHDLGTLCSLGTSEVMDYAKAAAMFQKACAAGVSESCADLGNAYFDGRGVTKDERKGLQLVTDACRHGHAWACHSLGERYRDGLGVTPDPLKAFRLFEDACPKVQEACDKAESLRVRLRAEYDQAHPQAQGESPSTP